MSKCSSSGWIFAHLLTHLFYHQLSMEFTDNAIRAHTVCLVSFNISLARIGLVVVEIDNISKLLKWETFYSIITQVIFAQVTSYCH
jgi:hypothetical protein